MSQRIVIGLEPRANWASVKAQLLADGAASIRDPSPEQPDVVVATLPADANVDEFIRVAKGRRGVRYVEPDAMQSTY